MSKEEQKIAKFQVGFGYWVVFCFLFGMFKIGNILLNYLINLHTNFGSDFGISLISILLMLIFLILFQVKPYIYKDGSLNKNPFAFKITDRR